jgi:methylglyoxal/glyoxal reductase
MTSPTINLNSGTSMPLLGLGVYDLLGHEAEKAILEALEIGYRLIDTAAMYDNEQEVGNAVRRSGIPREQIFITTKVHNHDQGFEATLRAFDTSLKKINTGYIDLYLIHWPLKKSRKETWRALEKLYDDGLVKAIGVANYLVPFLEEMNGYSKHVPSVDQVEFSPYLNLSDLVDYSGKAGIVLQAYSPLARGRRMTDPKLLLIAGKYQKTPAQIMLRWILQHGVSTIPKSGNIDRLKENFAVFDFELSADDMQAMNHFHENLRVADDPITML